MRHFQLNLIDFEVSHFKMLIIYSVQSKKKWFALCEEASSFYTYSAPGFKKSIFFSEGSYEESMKKWFTTFLWGINLFARKKMYTLQQKCVLLQTKNSLLKYDFHQTSSKTISNEANNKIYAAINLDRIWCKLQKSGNLWVLKNIFGPIKKANK